MFDFDLRRSCGVLPEVPVSDSRASIRPHRRVTRALLLPVLAVSLIVAGCGGGDGGDSGAEATLDQAFSGGSSVESGKLDLTLSAQTEEMGGFEGSLAGPFIIDPDGGLPQVELSASGSSTVPGQEQSLDAGVVISPDNAFVSFQGQTFEVGQALFAQFKAAADATAAESDSGESVASLEQFGVDPKDWFTDLTDNGTEDVGGVSTKHISGSIDIEKVFADLESIAAQTGQESQFNSVDVETVTEGISDATFDLYTGADDNIIRKLDASFTVTGQEDVADCSDHLLGRTQRGQ